jgi:hypothetical protein
MLLGRWEPLGRGRGETGCGRRAANLLGQGSPHVPPGPPSSSRSYCSKIHGPWSPRPKLSFDLLCIWFRSGFKPCFCFWSQFLICFMVPVPGSQNPPRESGGQQPQDLATNSGTRNPTLPIIGCKLVLDEGYTDPLFHSLLRRVLQPLAVKMASAQLQPLAVPARA